MVNTRDLKFLGETLLSSTLSTDTKLNINNLEQGDNHEDEDSKD